MRVYRFTTYQDARRVGLVDGLVIFETNILRVSPFKSEYEVKILNCPFCLAGARFQSNAIQIIDSNLYLFGSNLTLNLDTILM